MDRAELEALIDAVIEAPSAINLQPWAFCIIRDTNLLERLWIKAKALMQRSPLAVTPDPHFAEMLDDPDFQIFHNAPALILICAVGEESWSHIDCTLAAQNLMLLAHGTGLGTCWIGSSQAWLETDEGRNAGFARKLEGGGGNHRCSSQRRHACPTTEETRSALARLNACGSTMEHFTVRSKPPGLRQAFQS